MSAGISAHRMSAAGDVEPLLRGFSPPPQVSRSGLELGAVGTIRQNDAAAGLLTAEFAGESLSLWHAAAEHVLVELLP